MATTYQLWDTDTRNLVAEFDTQEEALAAVKRTLEVDGRELAETLFLGVDEEGAAGGVIAQGAALVALAQSAARGPGSSGTTGSGSRDGAGEERREGQTGVAPAAARPGPPAPPGR